MAALGGGKGCSGLGTAASGCHGGRTGDLESSGEAVAGMLGSGAGLGAWGLGRALGSSQLFGVESAGLGTDPTGEALGGGRWELGLSSQ